MRKVNVKVLALVAVCSSAALLAFGQGGNPTASPNQSGTASDRMTASTVSHDHLLNVNCVEVQPGEKRPEFGCFIIATEKGLQFSQPTVYWHLRTFPTRAAAEAARSATGIVVQEDGRVWLSEFGPRDSGPRGGKAVAEIGPLELPPAKTYEGIGETMTVAPNVPMQLSIVGATVRRSLVLIIHDSDQAAIIPSDWKPSGACGR